jgi:hypothetical protein
VGRSASRGTSCRCTTEIGTLVPSGAVASKRLVRYSVRSYPGTGVSLTKVRSPVSRSKVKAVRGVVIDVYEVSTLPVWYRGFQPMRTT